jgi:hypothetical protein
MPLWRLRCKIYAPDFLTRKEVFSVPKNSEFPLERALKWWTLLRGTQLFDEGHSVYLMQGGRPREDLLQGGFPKAGQALGLGCPTNF